MGAKAPGKPELRLLCPPGSYGPGDGNRRQRSAGRRLSVRTGEGTPLKASRAAAPAAQEVSQTSASAGAPLPSSGERDVECPAHPAPAKKHGR